MQTKLTRAQWETYQIQQAINRKLASAYLPHKGDPDIPIIIPEWYSLHYLTLCSGTFVWPSNMTSNRTRELRYKNATSTHCTSRWFNEATNFTQILLYAAATGLRDTNNFPADKWNETIIDEITNNVASIVVLDYQYDSSTVYPAVATLFTGFAFAVFSTPLVMSAAYIALQQKAMFRTLPHISMAFAALGAIFLTASARLESRVANSFTGPGHGDPKITVSSSWTFQGFQWTAALGMWTVVFFVWLGGIRGRKIIVIGSRYRKKSLVTA